MAKRVAVEVISALLCLLFLYTATSKLIDHEVFVFQLERMPYIHAWATMLSWIVQISEIIISGLLIIKPARLAGLLASVELDLRRYAHFE